MFELIEQELKNVGITENGAIGLNTSGHALLDINYQVSSLRGADANEIEKLFEDAFEENPEYALKWLFFARDVREGIGERRLFRTCYKKLIDLNKDSSIKNLKYIPEFGRWDDLICLIGVDGKVDEHVIDMIKNQLDDDIKNMNDNEPISLLSKWMPSENASSKTTKSLARKLIKALNLSPRKYRLMLSKMRAYLDVVEVKACNNKWNQIKYETVPSLANLKYKDAFLRHDEERRKKYLDSVSKGTAKMNMNVATPVDVVTRYGSRYIKEYDETLELAWKNLKNADIKNTLVVADGSGSMTIPVSGNTTALDVANSIAIYTSERNSGIYKNKYITFSSRPQFVEFGDDDTLRKKLDIAKNHNEISNTNIEAVFDLILQIAIKYDIKKEDMIENILIISDMEFDEAQEGWWSTQDGPSKILSNSLFEIIKNRYIENGYLLPKLIFWNVNSRTKTIPLVENEMGVVLISGFSQNVLQMVMSNKYDPYEVLIETITKERYKEITL